VLYDKDYTFKCIYLQILKKYISYIFNKHEFNNNCILFLYGVRKKKQAIIYKKKFENGLNDCLIISQIYHFRHQL